MIENSDVTDGDIPLGNEGAGAMPSWMRGAAAPDALEPDDDFGQSDVAAGTSDDESGAESHGDGGATEPEGESVAAADDAPAAGADDSAEVVIVLPSRARLPEAEDLTERLRAAIRTKSLVIDARDVEEITTPVVTAIISALRSRADITPPASVLAPTAAFVDAFSDLGLFQDLMKMEFRQ
jgi:hypothetical protein